VPLADAELFEHMLLRVQGVGSSALEGDFRWRPRVAEDRQWDEDKRRRGNEVPAAAPVVGGDNSKGFNQRQRAGG
jgi:hypothetical protein